MNNGLLIRAVSWGPTGFASNPSSKRQRGHKPRNEVESVSVPHLSQTPVEFKIFTTDWLQPTASMPEGAKGYYPE
jgi:hypothetical protein